MGGKIVVHSFRLLFTNLGNALKVSVGPYLIGVVACLAVLGAAGVPFLAIAEGSFDPTVQNVSGGTFLASMLVCLLILLFVSGWVAVAWHRYVLLEEYPGLLPGMAGRPVWPYVGRAMLLTVVLLLLSIPLGMVMALAVQPMADGAGDDGALAVVVILGIVFGTILSYVWMRLGLILPAVAVGRPIPMGESWRLTASLSGAIFVAVLIIMALNVGASAVLGLVLGDGTVSAILSIIVDWVSIMVGISVLTTLYGVIVERRALD